MDLKLEKIQGSLIEIGDELFKNSRRTNDLEAKGINAFVRSKSIRISSKEITHLPSVEGDGAAV